MLLERQLPSCTVVKLTTGVKEQADEACRLFQLHAPSLALRHTRTTCPSLRRGSGAQPLAIFELCWSKGPGLQLEEADGGEAGWTANV